MNAEQQIQKIYDDFIAAHPNSREPFAPTLENILRWRWSISEAEKRKPTDEQLFDVGDNRDSLEFAKSRSVETFEQLPTLTRERFLFLASLFPGRNVYATGSRITGEFIDKDSPQIVITMRKQLLKKETQQSDYDITLDFKDDDNINELKKRLPDFGDLIINVPLSEPKIKIPMWDFTKLPREKFDEVVELVESKQWGKLMAIHNEFALSNTFFCCDSKPSERWFTWAVENKVIQRTEKMNKHILKKRNRGDEWNPKKVIDINPD